MSFNKNFKDKLGKFKGRLAVGLVVAALTATVGAATVGAVHALSPGDLPTTKEECKDEGWMNFKNADGSMMFKNQGECVSTVEQNNGHGYGGSNGNNINANVSVSLNNSNNNIINVIVRLIFGA
jgi:hypothetical protein